MTESEGGKSPISILKGNFADNSEQGTFGTREVALKVAQWINVTFEIWCTKQIDTLFQTGKVELKLSQTLPSNYLEALKSLVIVEERKLELESENLTLKTQLDELTDYVSIIKVANHNKVSEKTFNWRLIKAKSIELDYPIKKAPSPRFGFQNLYSIKAFKTVYPEFDYCFNSVKTDSLRDQTIRLMQALDS